MKELKGYIKELLSLVNTTELSVEQIGRMKDLVCFLSEKKKVCMATEEEKKRLEYILYSASVRMRTFGYNRLNSFSAEKFNTRRTSAACSTNPCGRRPNPGGRWQLPDRSR